MLPAAEPDMPARAKEIRRPGRPEALDRKDDREVSA